jgi:hypothetical protein
MVALEEKYVTALDTKQQQPQNASTWTPRTQQSKPWTRNNTVNCNENGNVVYKAYLYLTAVYAATYTRVEIHKTSKACF